MNKYKINNSGGIASEVRPDDYISSVMGRVENGELEVSVEVNSFGFATRTFHETSNDNLSYLNEGTPSYEDTRDCSNKNDAPQPDRILDDEPTPTQIAHWLADHEATLINLRGPRGYALFFNDDREMTGQDPLVLIKKAML